MTERVPGPASCFLSIEGRYGRPINDWLELIRSSKATKHKALVGWLKADYGLGHGYATAQIGYAPAQRGKSSGGMRSGLVGTRGPANATSSASRNVAPLAPMASRPWPRVPTGAADERRRGRVTPPALRVALVNGLAS